MVAAAACLLSACGSSGGGSDSAASTPANGTAAAGGGGTTASGGGTDCSVTLYDGEDFKDTHFKLTKAGDYKNLKNLPGASEDWTDEADSAKVGSAATVTIYEKTGFNGKSATLKPGSDHSSVDPEPSSLKLSC
jgi:hypothetical protein